MARQEKMLAKKRGRPATGRGKTVGVRCHNSLLESIDEWRRSEPDRPTRARAIRRLVERALATAAPSEPAKVGSRRKAADLAGQAIDSLGDQTASVEERAHRKRRLIKGPREFRDVRGDQPKKKG
jgi:hypothetical protein